MSQIIDTSVGRFRRVNRDGELCWLFECPGCKTWGSLDDYQWAGLVSVDHASQGCEGRYHETHNYGAALQAAITAALLTDTPVSHDEEP